MTRCLLLLIVSFVPLVPAWGGHTLSSEEHQVLRDWLGRHPKYRLAMDKDCDCAGNIEEMRQGMGGDWKPVRDYHPYVATGDFNGDGAEDFAVVLIDRTKQEKNFVLIVFNGPFSSETQSPAFMQSGIDLKYLRPTPAKTVSASVGSVQQRFGIAADSARSHLSAGVSGRGVNPRGSSASDLQGRS